MGHMEEDGGTNLCIRSWQHLLYHDKYSIGADHYLTFFRTYWFLFTDLFLQNCGLVFVLCFPTGFWHVKKLNNSLLTNRMRWNKKDYFSLFSLPTIFPQLPKCVNELSHCLQPSSLFHNVSLWVQETSTVPGWVFNFHPHSGFSPGELSTQVSTSCLFLPWFLLFLFNKFKADNFILHVKTSGCKVRWWWPREQLQRAWETPMVDSALPTVPLEQLFFFLSKSYAKML